MPEVRIRSTQTSFADLVADHIATSGWTTNVVEGTGTRSTLRHRVNLAPEVRDALVRSLAPLTFRIEAVPDLDVDVELTLADSASFDVGQLRVITDNAEFGEAIANDLVAAGFTRPAVSIAYVDAPLLKYGGASRAARQVVQFVLGKRGIPSKEERAWPAFDTDLWLQVPDPALASVPPRSRFTVEVHTDDQTAAAPLVNELRSAGFRVELGALPSSTDFSPRRFVLSTGPFAAAHGTDDERDLRAALDRLLRTAGVDEAAYPVQVRGKRARLTMDSEGVARIELPIGAYLKRALRPYAGDDPRRFGVRILTDAPEAVGDLILALGALTGEPPEVERAPRRMTPTRVSAGSAQGEPLFDEVCRAVDATVLRLCGKPPTRPVERRRLDSDDPRIVVELQTTKLDEPISEAQLRVMARRHDLTLIVPTGTDVAAISADFRAAGFRRIRVNPQAHMDEASIQFGGAPQALVDKVLEVWSRHATVEPELDNAWSNSDNDIFVHLPEDALKVVSSLSTDARTEVPQLAHWVHGESTSCADPFLEVCLTTVRVGGLELPRRLGERHPLAPRRHDFRHWCLDALTAETLLHIARSVAMREPCLLEGDTSTAKTSSILYLAAALGQPVARVNLHGQTEPGELIGRYVPRAEGDPDGPPWRFQEGAVVRALREGHWLLLDEVNLAEPQVLERLNSLLEREPSLVVTEHDHRRIGSQDIHPDFRIFATMNPAEYAGRSALSPAWRDRWRAHRVVPIPGEREIEQFLRASVLGELPAVDVCGHTFAASRHHAPWASLATAPGMAIFLASLARFHVSLERALAQADGPGRQRRDRYVVTRRNLISVLDFLVTDRGSHHAMREAIVRYYVERISPSDRAVVVRLLDAAGIGPGTWAVPASARPVAA